MLFMFLLLKKSVYETYVRGESNVVGSSEPSYRENYFTYDHELFWPNTTVVFAQCKKH